MNYPIIEFDNDEGILSPNYMIEGEKIPEICILCFFSEIYENFDEKFVIKKILNLFSPLGKHPIFIISNNNITFSVFNPGLGGPMAAGFLEELIALGARKFILCGSAGVIRNIDIGTLILPSFAIRDEGTSYHYLPACERIALNGELCFSLKDYLYQHGIEFIVGGTWTTDAIYRETSARKKRRLEQGCVCVEMEVASLKAVAQFRNVDFVPLLYAGDILREDNWDSRNWKKSIPSKFVMFQLCCDFVGEYVHAMEK